MRFLQYSLLPGTLSGVAALIGMLNDGAPMTEAQLMTELAESCRRLACYQRNPNILDMLHDLEEDFAQKAGMRVTATSGRNGSLLPSAAYI
jgi:hypothetical protein